ncbi:MAG: hypothetical protein IKP27_06445 [Paludibacteraceae bacterium]|nr:hypothetical protein [Paludibacteraceae bacterium]
MRRTFSKTLFASVLIAATFFAACKDDDTVAVNDVELNLEQITTSVGEHILLKATVRPENADNKAVKWNYDKRYLRKEGEGIFIALHSGQTVIYVVTEDGEFTESCLVNIHESDNGSDSNQDLLKNIDFKDTNLLNVLTGEGGFDLDGDKCISRYEARLVKSLNIAYKGITSFDEINYFTNLEELYCHDNKLTTIDLSKQTKLRKFYCSQNQFTTLDVSHNLDLDTLICDKNSLSTLDVSKNSKLKTLYCGSQINGEVKLKLTNNQFITFWQEMKNSMGNINVETEIIQP